MGLRRHILPLMDRINSNVGFCISEETIGTNGVGSVIEHGQADADLGT